jgi:UDP-N-acetylglucosamine--N-acetylmuramyl-(pentapeptide) pyrophosphoryl-undecaprenol N-acetylglucosamine transferase
MRVVFCGGGTGGHVYPALTVAAALRGEMKRLSLPVELLYIGVRGKMDAELVARESIPFQAVTAGPMRSSSPIGLTAGLLRLGLGFIEALKILRRFRPDAVFATGGYGSVGVALASRTLRLPLLVFLPDVQAGLAVRTLARVATKIAVSVAAAEKAMPTEKTLLTGYPVRAAFFEAQRDEARRALGLDPLLPVLLVTGGSTGATRINRAIASRLPDYLQDGQLLHVSGRNDYSWLDTERQALQPHLRPRYHLYDYLHTEMPLALAAADLGVMRAGASTLGELPAARLPAVLIPGDFSDQADNARYLEDEGAAVMLPESRLDALHETIAGLAGDHGRLNLMREKLAGLARPDAAGRLARLIMELARVRQGVSA